MIDLFNRLKSLKYFLLVHVLLFVAHGVGGAAYMFIRKTAGQESPAVYGLAAGMTLIWLLGWTAVQFSVKRSSRDEDEQVAVSREYVWFVLACMYVGTSLSLRPIFGLTIESHPVASLTSDAVTAVAGLSAAWLFSRNVLGRPAIDSAS